MPNQKPNPTQKPITNPELVEALKVLHQENTPQNQGKVLGLVVERALFLAPAVITPAPQQSEAPDGRKQATIQFQLITTKDGRPFFPAFTDADELRKFAGNQKQLQSVVLRFDDYVSLVARNEKACGFVVNPLGLSLTLDRKTVANLAEKKKDIQKLYPTETNFLYLKTEHSGEIFEALKKEGISIRNMNGYLRISAGSRAENQDLIRALDKLLQ